MDGEKGRTVETRGERLTSVLYGLVGHPLGHSWSPQIHERLGSTPYALHDLLPEEVGSFLRGGAWRGLNVTVPYKRLAAEVADVRSPAVVRLGAANTLVRDGDGRIVAENTDVLGFSWMLDRFCRTRLGGSPHELLGGRKVLVLGSGGASAAVRDALDINLLKLESRPNPERDFEFMFYFDLECPVAAPEFSSLKATIGGLCQECRYLGSYAEVL